MRSGGRLIDHGVDPTVEAMAEHRKFIDALSTGDWKFQFATASLVQQSGVMAEGLTDVLMAREWAVYRTPPVLLTSDEPVVPVGGPRAVRNERGGVEAGGVVLFPLAPNALLVMFGPGARRRPPWELSHTETVEVNREILAHVSRWAFERPGRRFAVSVQVPPHPTKFLRREEQPLAADDTGADPFVYRKRTRWASISHPPSWPVARWWS